MHSGMNLFFSPSMQTGESSLMERVVQPLHMNQIQMRLVFQMNQKEKDILSKVGSLDHHEVMK
jgi:hypothetical protein